jgi:hypothetical protein
MHSTRDLQERSDSCAWRRTWVRVDSYDSSVNATVNITDTTITDSPYSAFEFVSGGRQGHPVRNVTVDGATVRNTGTVVVQAEAQGAATSRNVTATSVGAAGVYNCPYPAGCSNRSCRRRR